MEKGMTVRDLIDKLEWSIENGYIKDDDYVFYILPKEDEGSVDSLRPVVNIANPSIPMRYGDAELVEGMLQKEAISLCFINHVK